jgi:hypothetical protein
MWKATSKLKRKGDDRPSVTVQQMVMAVISKVRFHSWGTTYMLLMNTASWPEDLKGKTVWRDTGNVLTRWVTISFSRNVRSAFRFLYGPKLLSNENGLSYFVNGTRFDVTIRVSYNYSSKNNSCCRQITGERGLGKTQISSRSREFSLLQLTAVHIKHGDDVPTESEVRDVVYVKYVLLCVCVCVQHELKRPVNRRRAPT